MRDDEVKKGGVLSFKINYQLRASALTVRALVRCSRRKLAVEVKIPVATAPAAHKIENSCGLATNPPVLTRQAEGCCQAS